jgi:hypothetical protein
MRRCLAAHQHDGTDLTQWKRAFFLDAALQPTRRNVLGLDYIRGDFQDDWFDPRMPYDSPEIVAANRQVVGAFRDSLVFRDDEGHPQRTADQIHGVVGGTSLNWAYEELLTGLRMTNLTDSQNYTGLLLQIRAYLDSHPDCTCTIFLMRRGDRRRRGLDGQGRILNLFQGPYPDRHGAIYPGDRQKHAPHELTIQIHRLTIRTDEGVVADDVPVVAVWVPREMSASWISQQMPAAQDARG